MDARFKILGKVGEGAHGVVLKAKCVETGEIVALKKIPCRKLEEGIPVNIIREIKALQQINGHENVVQLQEFFPTGSTLTLVFEYMLVDLAEILRNATEPLAESRVKAYVLMLLKGVAFWYGMIKL
jgi:cell cycle related kinase